MRTNNIYSHTIFTVISEISRDVTDIIVIV